MRTHKETFYFETRKDATDWAVANGWPIGFIREYGLGYAVQACNSGRYAGPDSLTWPGADWSRPFGNPIDPE